MKRKINRIHLEGDNIIIFRNWHGRSYCPDRRRLEKICELASMLVNEEKALVTLDTTGWYVDLKED